MSAERVAGTRIERAVDDDRTTTFLVSDLHIPAGGGAVLGRFRELVDLAAATPKSRLVVLGDLFDAYIGPKQARVGVWRDTAELLAAAAAKGLSVTLLHGNRDYMLDVSFARRAGCRCSPTSAASPPMRSQPAFSPSSPMSMGSKSA